MEIQLALLNILLVAAIASFGYPAGLILKRYALEEVKKGKQYFILLSDLTLIIAAIFSIFAFVDNIIAAIIIVALCAIVIYTLHPKPILGYPIMIILFLLSSGKQSIIIIVASLIFIYGLAAAALMKNGKAKRRI